MAAEQNVVNSSFASASSAEEENMKKRMKEEDNKEEEEEMKLLPTTTTTTMHSEQTLQTLGQILDHRHKNSLAKLMSQTAEALADSFDTFRKSSQEDLVFDLFKLPQRDEASIGKLIAVLRSFGLQPDDPRLEEMMEKIQQLDMEAMAADGAASEHSDQSRHLPRETFKACIHPCIALISRALRNQLIIPNWAEFCTKIRELFEECRSDQGGEVATYIPQLARADPEKWGLSICTIDGQRFSIGDCRLPWCFQSVSKAFNYAIVASDLGESFVHSYVGHEPSGRLFNEICLDPSGKPHNPMINSGAIIVTSLLRKGLPMADRYDFALKEYKKLAGDGYIGFNNATFLSEKKTADRNYALSYYMKENKCFPAGIESIREELDFYFQLCSLETHCESAAVMAATLANGGVCPLTEECCIQSRPCRDVLSLMYSCGMYDYSGQFAFHVGLPAKSGVSGGMAVVIPNLMGISLFSPRLDKMGNSTRGVLFCQKLIDTFNFHNYDSLLHADSKKIDPRRRIGNKETDLIVNLLFACKNGDLDTVRRLYLQGMNLNVADYDGRTALHLAACEGHTLVLKFLLNVARVDHAVRDRWGRTALDDARTFHRTACVALILKSAQKRQQQQHHQQRRPSAQRQAAVNGESIVGLGTVEPLETGGTSTVDSEDETAGGIGAETCTMAMGSGGSSGRAAAADEHEMMSSASARSTRSGRSGVGAGTARWVLENALDRLSLHGREQQKQNDVGGGEAADDNTFPHHHSSVGD